MCKSSEWWYENGCVDRETHPEPGKEGMSKYLCDCCGCVLEVAERPCFFPTGELVCEECFNM